MMALAMFIVTPDCSVATVPLVRLKSSKHLSIAEWKKRRLAIEKSTASFNLLFLGEKNKGGKAPNDAFACDVSRARLLKNAPI